MSMCKMQLVQQLTSHKDESYWLGVRDALRMVDSFLKWSKRHPDRAKSLEDFINDGLIAAAKRCEECLSYALGVEFREGEEAQEEDILSESSDEMVEEPEFSDEISSEQPATDVPSTSAPAPSFEMPDDESAAPRVVSKEEELDTIADSLSKTSELEEPPSASETEATIDQSIDDEEEIPPAEEEISPDEIIKDFKAEFHIGEPESMDEATEEHESKLSDEEDTTESEVSEPVASEMDTTEEPKSSESDESVGDEGDDSFTWDDYEDALTPRVASPYGPAEKESDAELEEEEDETWSPLDEPSVEEEAPPESTSAVETPTDEKEEDEASKKEKSIEPPPPPPPQDEEDEDERRKRARRLFFGA